MKEPTVGVGAPDDPTAKRQFGMAVDRGVSMRDNCEVDKPGGESSCLTNWNLLNSYFYIYDMKYYNDILVSRIIHGNTNFIPCSLFHFN